MIAGIINIARQVVTREITIKQAYYYIEMRLFNKQAHLSDDFDWTKYSNLYREELKSISLKSTILPKTDDFEFNQGRLIQINKSIMPLHPNHHLLYELVLRLRPATVLEVGCGGGDHLRNLHLFDSSIELFGIDRSDTQMDMLKSRHPGLNANLRVADLTDPATVLPKTDIVYSQAVLMHISEKNGRFSTAIDNVLEAALSQVVLVENWTEHDFLAELRAAVERSSSWQQAKLYYAYLPESPYVRALVLSRSSLSGLRDLTDYDQLLQGHEMRVH